MGIKGLMKLLREECPEALTEGEVKNYTGRKVAVDASMVLYQFIIATRIADQTGNNNVMMTSNGDITAHLQGIFNRTIRLLANGVKPVYVFDGKPPDLKSTELQKRKEAREKATALLKVAENEDNQEDINKYSKRLTRIGRKQNEEAKRLLTLMGMPIVNAPTEAEAQCAEMAKKGIVYGVATEDMDTLTFRSPRILRYMLSSANKDQPVIRIELDVALAGLELTYEEFVDLCILCGCDYCDSIRGVGPKTALKLIKEYHTIENIIQWIQKNNKKYDIPDSWLKPEKNKESIRGAKISNDKKEKLDVEEKKNSDEIISNENNENNENNIPSVPISDNNNSFSATSTSLSDNHNNNNNNNNTSFSSTSAPLNNNFFSSTSTPLTNNSFSSTSTPLTEKKDDNTNTFSSTSQPLSEIKNDNKNISIPSTETKEDYTNTLSSNKIEKRLFSPKKEEKLDEQKDDMIVEEENVEEKKDKENNNNDNDDDDDEVNEENWIPIYVRAREFFKQPEVTDGNDITFQWNSPDEAGLIQFLCDEMEFDKGRVEGGIQRLKKAKKHSNQKRLDSFFKILPSTKTKKRKLETKTKTKAKGNKKFKGKR